MERVFDVSFDVSVGGELDLAPLTDPERLAAYRDAAANWRFEGFIRFATSDQAKRWTRSNLNDMAASEIAQHIAEFVACGGEIDEVRERRGEWQDRYEFHYDLRLTIQAKLVYIETRLVFSPPFRPDDPYILVVNIHAP